MARAISYLAQLFPTKTGAELIAMHKEEKKQDFLEVQESLKEELVIIDAINSEDAYYKGTFCLNQYTFRRVYNARIECDELIVDVENIIIFDSSNEQLERERNGMSIERRTDTMKEYNNYGFSDDNKTTKEEWDKINAHLDFTVENFWGVIDPNS